MGKKLCRICRLLLILLAGGLLAHIAACWYANSDWAAEPYVVEVIREKDVACALVSDKGLFERSVTFWTKVGQCYYSYYVDHEAELWDDYKLCVDTDAVVVKENGGAMLRYDTTTKTMFGVGRCAEWGTCRPLYRYWRDEQGCSYCDSEELSSRGHPPQVLDENSSEYLDFKLIETVLASDS